MNDVNHEYVKRIDRVIDYLRDNLDQTFKLDELADIACFSKYHFHRIFSVISGETLNNYTNRLRLEKATKLLRHSSDNLTIVAFECGFSSSATFSRSFSKAYGMSPNEFRKNKNFKKSKIGKELFEEDEYLLPMTVDEKKKTFTVEIKELPKWYVNYIRVLNSYEEGKVLRAFEKIINKAKTDDTYEDGVLFGMTLDDPAVTPKHLFRYEACIAHEREIMNKAEFSKMEMPKRSYACVKINGDLKLNATAWHYLYGDWLVNSEYEPDHAPALEIFLNKEKALDWSNLELELCLPVKKMINI